MSVLVSFNSCCDHGGYTMLSNSNLFHLSSSGFCFTVRAFTMPNAVPMMCSLVSRDRPSHKPLVHEEVRRLSGTPDFLAITLSANCNIGEVNLTIFSSSKAVLPDAFTAKRLWQ